MFSNFYQQDLNKKSMMKHQQKNLSEKTNLV